MEMVVGRKKGPVNHDGIKETAGLHCLRRRCREQSSSRRQATRLDEQQMQEEKRIDKSSKGHQWS